MYNIYLIKYNNYYNRILKVIDDDYIASTSRKVTLTDYNFDFNDGLTTKIVVNLYDARISLYDYVYAKNTNFDETSLDGIHIRSRWFIIGIKKIRAGQYELYLKRDLLADYKSEIMSAPCFVEKGYCGIDDPAFFNDERIDVNRIITKETPIKDEMGLPWIVAYITKGTGWESTTPIKYNNGERQTPYATFFSTASALNMMGNGYYYNTDKSAKFEMLIRGFETIAETTSDVTNCYRFNTNSSGTSATIVGSSSSYGATVYNYSSEITDPIWSYSTNLRDYACQAIGVNYVSVLPGDQYNGKIVKCGDSYYKVKVSYTSETVTKTASFTTALNLYNAIQKNMLTFLPATVPTTGTFGIQCVALKCTVTLTEVYQYNQYSTYLTSDRNHCDSFDILATPLPKELYYFRTNGSTDRAVSVSAEKLIMSFYGSLSEYLSTERVYDVQVIPYNPIPSLYTGVRLDLSALTSGEDFIVDGSSTFPILYLTNNNIETIIENTDDASLNPDIQKEYFLSRKFRLIAPNFSNTYDLPVYENKGINSFHVDMTLLPYQSYLRIRPTFQYLNGIEEDDSRGLVVGGSLSLTQLSSAWANYQYSNMNYEAIQNTSIEFTKYQYELQNKKNLISGVANAVSSGISGAVGGGLVGGIPGAIGGGITSLATSTIGLGLDQKYDRELQARTLDYTKDMYQLNLGNIKGQTPTLSKLTALNICYKWWPYIEQSDCTETELTAIWNKLKYNGMTINRIGKLEDFTRKGYECYIKGKIIRLELENFEIVNAIAEEVNQGFYITEV